MKKIAVEINEQMVLEYNYELFKEHIPEILLRATSEGIAILAAKEVIVLKDYSDLSKLNDLMIRYLINK